MHKIGNILSDFLKRRGDPQKTKLISLWKAWEDLFGNLALEMVPVGHRDDILILGVENSLLIQEFQFVEEQILNRVNTFLGYKRFEKVRFELIKGRASLNLLQLDLPEANREINIPENLGHLDLPADSEVGRVYAKYVRLMQEKKNKKAMQKKLDSEHLDL